MEKIIEKLKEVQRILREIDEENQRLPQNLGKQIGNINDDLNKKQFALLQFLAEQCFAAGFTSKKNYISPYHGTACVFFTDGGHTVTKYVRFLDKEKESQSLEEWFSHIVRFPERHFFLETIKAMISAIKDKENSNKIVLKDIREASKQFNRIYNFSKP